MSQVVFVSPKNTNEELKMRIEKSGLWRNQFKHLLFKREVGTVCGQRKFYINVIMLIKINRNSFLLVQKTEKKEDV